nr:UvrD-helicase domain-containing protein [Corallococcus sp. AS-1-6]
MTSRVGKPDTSADLELRSCLDSQPPRSFVMTAGAGSGKTTSLVKALSHLAQTRGTTLWQRGQRIACITYTEVAVKEILTDVKGSPLFHVSTIHSFLWSLIKPFQDDIQGWVLRDIEARCQELRKSLSEPKGRRQQQTLDRDKAALTRLDGHLSTLQSGRGFIYGNGTDYSKRILGHEAILRMVPELMMQSPLLRKLVSRRFPFLFVDESQDTFPKVVDALRAVAKDAIGTFCLGFFGDPMQEIFPGGAGEIKLEPEWARITKPENFRSSPQVLSVLNRIRAHADKIEQVHGNSASWNGAQGAAHLFVVPGDDKRDERLLAVRHQMAEWTQDPSWAAPGGTSVRNLVLVHRMSARRLGFPDLYSALNDGAPDRLKAGFLDGTAWPLKPFLGVIVPLVEAARNRREFEVIDLMRRNCPRLAQDRLVGADVSALLRDIQKDLNALIELCSSESARARCVLNFVQEHELVSLEKKLIEALERKPTSEDASNTSFKDDDSAEGHALAAYLDCPASQIWHYRVHQSDESPFSTQQGVKGAEFDRVLTVIDEEEGSHPHFSYDKYFRLKEPSPGNRHATTATKDPAIERTRRLFYVCCSRAIRELAVVVFTKDVKKAVVSIQESGLFPSNQIHASGHS